MKRALFVGRFQPLHSGHVSVIKEMEKDVDELIIGIGSSQYGNTAYNPFTAKEREEMLKNSLDLKKKFHIVKIPDLNDYEKWVDHVVKLCPKFDIIYTGNKGVVKKLFEEKGYEVRTLPHKVKISSTEIRKLMMDGDEWQYYLPEGVIKVIAEVEGIGRLKVNRSKRANPDVVVDIIINYKDQGIVFVKRRYEPFKGFWALPGGGLDTGEETVEMAAIREAKEETNLDIDLKDLKLLKVYSKPSRDPRGPSVSIAYSVKVNKGVPKAGDDAKEVEVLKEIPENLAFDHREILGDYFEKCKK